MTEKENDDFLVEIEKSDDITRIRISGVRKNDFDKAYRLASQLNHRVKELDLEIEDKLKLNSAIKEISHLWTQQDSVWILNESVSDASHRIALSLLWTHPECKKQADIVKMTNVPQKTVSNHLSGKVDSTRQYFYEWNKGHRLSDEGLQWVIERVIPSISIMSRET